MLGSSECNNHITLMEREQMQSFNTQPLNTATWDAFAKLVEKSNGVWGGCWCMGFHEEGFGKERSAEKNKHNKECRVRKGTAHAALVFDGDNAIGWCQFGKPEELPRIKMKKEYETKIKDQPDWRITCFFVGKKYRGKGISEIALKGALQEIVNLGGGIVESYPEEIANKKTSSSFLYNSSLGIFERNGFERIERLGKNHWVVQKRV